MDYDSSSKFISSLAKFLQSLCNGYVEFDNGVEVIGHIYLSVDTGKKIDYILNEKVCKTDENSVTFISNSFHAQPAEKPKSGSKKGRIGDQESAETVVEIDEGNKDVEPRSTNTGTIPRNQHRNVHSSSPSLRKRPFSPHSKGSNSTSKKGRNESSQEQDNFGMVSNEGSIPFSTSNSSDPLRGSSSSHLTTHPASSQSFNQSFNLDDSNVDNTGDRDVKPSMDTDVTFVKEEFGTSQTEEGKTPGLEASFSSMYSANQSYGEGLLGQSHNLQNSRLTYGEDRSDNGIYDSTMIPSQVDGSEGRAGADSSASTPVKSLKRCLGRNGRQNVGIGSPNKTSYPVGECGFCPDVFYDHEAFEEHIGLVDTIASRCDGEEQMKMFRCCLCQISLPKLRQIRGHLQQCPYYNPSNSNLDESVRSENSTKVVYQCHHCDKSYSDKKGLKRHLLALDGVFYQCGFCGKQFSRQDTLSVHIKKVHELIM